jgi:hypothetical protein
MFSRRWLSAFQVDSVCIFTRENASWNSWFGEGLQVEDIFLDDLPLLGLGLMNGSRQKNTILVQNKNKLHPLYM